MLAGRSLVVPVDSPALISDITGKDITGNRRRVSVRHRLRCGRCRGRAS